MGYMICFAPCIRCGKPFGCNPELVPSLRINGQREPICEFCHGELNSKRIEAGLEPWPAPLPGAYEPEEVS